MKFAHGQRSVRAGVGRTHPWGARRWAAAVALAAAAMLQPATACAQTPAPVRTVPFVDLDRYAGDWFEIARFPNWFQRQCVGDVRASYARRPDGRLDVVNRCRTAEGETEARGVARIADERAFAKLKVRFAPSWLSWLPVVWGDYWIIGLAPDYSWAVVGDPGRDYLWILARAPHLDEVSVAAARAAARVSGYEVERLVQTSHGGVGARRSSHSSLPRERASVPRAASPTTAGTRASKTARRPAGRLTAGGSSKNRSARIQSLPSASRPRCPHRDPRDPTRPPADPGGPRPLG